MGRSVEKQVRWFWRLVMMPVLFGLVGASVNFATIQRGIIPKSCAIVIAGARPCTLSCLPGLTQHQVNKCWRVHPAPLSILRHHHQRPGIHAASQLCLDLFECCLHPANLESPCEVEYCQQERQTILIAPLCRFQGQWLVSCAACSCQSCCTCTGWFRALCAETKSVMMGPVFLYAGLGVRMPITYLVMLGSKFTWKEKLFFAIAWSPKVHPHCPQASPIDESRSTAKACASLL